jgi:hypothetical protein
LEVDGASGSIAIKHGRRGATGSRFARIQEVIDMSYKGLALAAAAALAAIFASTAASADFYYSGLDRSYGGFRTAFWGWPALDLSGGDQKVIATYDEIQHERDELVASYEDPYYGPGYAPGYVRANAFDEVQRRFVEAYRGGYYYGRGDGPDGEGLDEYAGPDYGPEYRERDYGRYGPVYDEEPRERWASHAGWDRGYWGDRGYGRERYYGSDYGRGYGYGGYGRPAYSWNYHRYGVSCSGWGD